MFSFVIHLLRKKKNLITIFEIAQLHAITTGSLKCGTKNSEISFFREDEREGS